MLNEERVKHMIKLADYETKGGKEEQKITSFYKKEYIGMNIMWTLLWMTVAYGLVVVTVWLALRDLVIGQCAVAWICAKIIRLIGLAVGLI